MSQKSKFRQKHNLPIFILLLVGTIAGLIIFSDFGVSWDEPEYYQYADATLKAYSLRDLVSGNYSLENAYGPADLRYYGPSYLILGKGIVSIFSFIFPKTHPIDLWHLTNYLFFLLGVFFFYKLTLRLTNQFAAMLGSLLFFSQPVLFGNAWINPKDIPLLVFFLGAIFFGVTFTDQMESFYFNWSPAKHNYSKTTNPWFLFNGFWRKFFGVIEGLLLTFTFVLIVFATQIKQSFAAKILAVNIKSPSLLFDEIFTTLVRNYADVSLTYYAEKVNRLYNHYLAILIVFTLLFLVLFIYLHRYPTDYRERWQFFKADCFEFKRVFNQHNSKTKLVFNFLAACLFLACASATRVIGPLAGFLILVLWIIRFHKKALPFALLYFFLTLLFFYCQWPFIWVNTWSRLVEVIRHMSSNPVGVNTLFQGVTYDSRHLPVGYFPGLLSISLTEPALIMAVIGIFSLLYNLIRRRKINLEWLIVLGWFMIPLAYILILRPPMYDNFRHFLFILPALFIVIAAGIHWLHEKISPLWIKLFLTVAILLPGVLGIIELHPYESLYYNSLVGGIKGAENQYDLDYWLTCYRELGKEVEKNESGSVDVYVDLNPELVSLYGYQKINVHSINVDQFAKNGLIFLPKRWDHMLLYEEYPIAYRVQLDGVNICIARRVQ